MGKRRLVKRWIRVPRVWHWRAKRYIYRHDGEDFVFPIWVWVM
ncbi:MAG: hypothetical protein ACRC8S_06750 [Fimbriiglobus sp.]